MKKANKKTDKNSINLVPGHDVSSQNMTELERLASFPRFNPQPVLEVNPQGTVLYLNPAGERLFPDLKVKSVEHPFLADFAKVVAYLVKIKEGIFRREIRTGDVWFEQFFSYSVENENIRVYCVDITERKRRETEIERLNRTLRAIGNSGNAMAHATSEQDLLDVACRIVVEDCGHMLVWIGYAEQNEAKTVRPVAQYGFDEGYIRGLEVTYADEPKGRGPTGTTIRTGKLCICRNMLTDPSFLPWRDAAVKRGYAASIVLPLVDGGKPFGAINIYSRDPDPFSEEEISLLGELASDISYGISSIRMRSERLRVEEELRKSEEKYRMFVETANEGIWATDAERKTTFVNERMADMLGYAKEEILGRLSAEFLDPGQEKTVLATRSELSKGIRTQFEFRLRKKDGSILWVISSATPLLDKNGNLLSTVAMLTDITERKKAEAALEKSRNDLETKILERTADLNLSNKSLEFEQRRFHQVLDALPVYVVLLSPDYHMPFANKFFTDRFGASGGRKCYEFLFDRTEPCEVCETYKVLETLTPREWEWTGPDNRNYYIYDFPFEDADGSTQILEMGIDVTERKLAEEELGKYRDHLEELVKSRTGELETANNRLEKEIVVRKQVEELTMLQNSVLDGINRILHASMTSASEEELGRSCLSVVEEVTQSELGFIGELNKDGTFDDIAVSDLTVFPDALQKTPKGFPIRGLFGKVIKDGKSFYSNNPAGHPDSVGTPHWHPQLESFLCVPLANNGRIIGMAGVANRKGGYSDEIEEALEALSGAIVEAFLRFRAERALRESEERYRSLFNRMTEGFALHQIVLDDTGKPIDYIFVEINPAFERLTGLERDKVVGRRLTEILPNEDPMWIEIYGDVALTGRSVHFDHFSTALGKHYEAIAYCPVHEMFAVQFLDITERKDAEAVLRRDKETFERLVNERTEELVEAQASLVHSKRLADIGTLSSTVAHELRNPLAVIAMAASNIKRKVKDPAIDRSIANIQKKISESNQIITNLLFYSRLRTPQYESVNYYNLIVDVVETVKAHCSGEVSFLMKLALIYNLSIEGDPLQLREVFTNLLGNSIDAVAGRQGRIVVTACVLGDTVSVTVEDNGGGISPQDIGRIFEPFFSTKTKGTGLGLVVCEQVIRMHSGKIEVASDPATGTIFTITLPIKKANQE